MNERSVRHASALLAFVLISGCTTVPSLPAMRGPSFARAPAVRPTPQEASTQVVPATQAVPPNSSEPPAVIGSRLHAAENETATQKAIELTRKLGEAESDRKRLATQVEELEAAGKTKDQALDQARTEIQSARAQMAHAREELEQWKQEIAALRDKVRGADEENLQTLQTAVALLQQILSQAAAEEHERSAAAAEHSSSE